MLAYQECLQCNGKCAVIYILQRRRCPSVVKLGYTSDARIRFPMLARWTFEPSVCIYVHVPSPKPIERIVHSLLLDYWLGREVFKCSKETALVAIAQAIQLNIPIPPRLERGSLNILYLNDTRIFHLPKGTFIVVIYADTGPGVITFSEAPKDLVHKFQTSCLDMTITTHLFPIDRQTAKETLLQLSKDLMVTSCNSCHVIKRENIDTVVSGLKTVSKSIPLPVVSIPDRRCIYVWKTFEYPNKVKIGVCSDPIERRNRMNREGLYEGTLTVISNKYSVCWERVIHHMLLDFWECNEVFNTTLEEVMQRVENLHDCPRAFKVSGGAKDFFFLNNNRILHIPEKGTYLCLLTDRSKCRVRIVYTTSPVRLFSGFRNVCLTKESYSHFFVMPKTTATRMTKTIYNLEGVIHRRKGIIECDPKTVEKILKFVGVRC